MGKRWKYNFDKIFVHGIIETIYFPSDPCAYIILSVCIKTNINYANCYNTYINQ